ncbi:hypothetical protein P1X15_04575 [Runella sp. MFBS21]|uniref:hypothetical protein n=1 Tax=Runella sp. MFBS21 TaxID=3034018 RepID=UPI0023F923D9|nr:hypothetical protein [Runella sp. MFBS21]MDF7816855.1 hypothetical protein [Runella sp. MFBS21]
MEHLISSIIIALLPFIFTAKISPPNVVQLKRLEELVPIFKKDDLALGFKIILVWWPVLTLIFGAIFWVLLAFFEPSYPDAKFFLSALYGSENQLSFAAGAGMLLGLGFLPFAIIVSSRNKYAQDFELYLFYTYQELNISLIAFARGFGLFWGITGGMLLLIMDGAYFKVNDTSIEFRHFFSLSVATYSFDEIRKISFSSTTKAPNGDTVMQDRYQITFKNGTSWVMDGWLSGNAPIDSVAEFLSKQTHLKIIYEPLSE